MARYICLQPGLNDTNEGILPLVIDTAHIIRLFLEWWLMTLHARINHKISNFYWLLLSSIINNNDNNDSHFQYRFNYIK